jgi:hypothetical protein
MNARARFLSEFPRALRDGAGAMFVGAGVSMSAGYPSWRGLLKEIGEELEIDPADVDDLAALAQWHVRRTSGYQRIRQVIKREIGKERPITEAVRAIARLPIQHIWTTNYDRLIERGFAEISRPIDLVSSQGSISSRAGAGAVRLYKMHGSIEALEDIVIATEDYELFRSKRGAYLPLLFGHLASYSFLFVGLSFSDPNIKHVLSLIRESFHDSPPEHFAIVRRPQREDYKTKPEYEARLRQHSLWADDLLRYGLAVVEVDDFGEIDDLLHEVERRVADDRVWISGSWPIGGAGRDRAAYVHDVAERLGTKIGDAGRVLVSGAGLLVGSASMSGFLSSLQRSRSWELGQRLIVRPFPQPFGGVAPDENQWTLLRKEMARVAGTVIFVGGAKEENGQLIDAPGVLEEMEIARDAGARLLPIGATGGAAATISQQLIGSRLPATGLSKRRPTDAALKRLTNSSLSSSELVDETMKVFSALLK